MGGDGYVDLPLKGYANEQMNVPFLVQVAEGGKCISLVDLRLGILSLLPRAFSLFEIPVKEGLCLGFTTHC